MTGVATLHIRNVPAEVVSTLKRRAATSGRSLNSEVVATLEESTGRRSIDEVLESIRRRVQTLPNRPTTDEIVAGIREAREDRTAQIRRAAGLPPVPRDD